MSQSVWRRRSSSVTWRGVSHVTGFSRGAPVHGGGVCRRAVCWRPGRSSGEWAAACHVPPDIGRRCAASWVWFRSVRWDDEDSTPNSAARACSPPNTTHHSRPAALSHVPATGNVAWHRFLPAPVAGNRQDVMSFDTFKQSLKTYLFSDRSA